MATESIRLRREQWISMAAHLTERLPEEGCGLLAGRAGDVRQVIPIENELHSRVRYRMEPRALVAALHRIDSEGLEMIGAFHSHPSGPFGVSDTDLDEWGYPEAALLVCVPREERWQARAYRIGPEGLREIELVIDDG